MMSQGSDIEIKAIGDTVTTALAGIAYEIGAQVGKVHARPEDWLNDDFVERTVRTAAIFVLTDYFLGKFVPRPYIIAADGGAITCTRCGKTSYHLDDVAQRYCAICKRFHTRYEGDDA